LLQRRAEGAGGGGGGGVGGEGGGVGGGEGGGSGRGGQGDGGQVVVLAHTARALAFGVVATHRHAEVAHLHVLILQVHEAAARPRTGAREPKIAADR